VVVPEHTVGFVTNVIVGCGFTVIVKLAGDPGQKAPPLVFTGVAVIVATKSDEPGLTAAKEFIS
jgi:hypothetical protein